MILEQFHSHYFILFEIHTSTIILHLHVYLNLNFSHYMYIFALTQDDTAAYIVQLPKHNRHSLQPPEDLYLHAHWPPYRPAWQSFKQRR